MRRTPAIRLKAPYLRRVWLDSSRLGDGDLYPFNLPLFRQKDFELIFDRAVTIVVGENGTGKSTLLEAIAALAGFDDAGGGNGYRPVDHAGAVETHGGALAQALRASWLPKVTRGWFFRAESFYAVARYLDAAALDAGAQPPDFLSHSHGEGFLRFFVERCQRQGVYLFDEPEAALSPARQIAFLKILRRIDESGVGQVIVATHSPLLMAYRGARLLSLDGRAVAPIALRDTAHFRLLSEFCADPERFLARALETDV